MSSRWRIRDYSRREKRDQVRRAKTLAAEGFIQEEVKILKTMRMKTLGVRRIRRKRRSQIRELAKRERLTFRNALVLFKRRAAAIVKLHREETEEFVEGGVLLSTYDPLVEMGYIIYA
ncbi:hypothetical protein LCGC14_1733460 [marine sediment metagenome]|uniref:Uncharacterized protein n=1 Tax=marine sediment metagenome TaxID=412755 RepID=A0A0F9H8M9_9ZZZZ